MNNKFETVMSWIMYVRAGIWKIEQLNEQADNPEYIKEKYELLFKNELCREYNDATEHRMPGLYKHIGSFLCWIDIEEMRTIIFDNYNVLQPLYNGIYKSFDNKKLCLDIKAKGFDSSYFSYQEKEDDRYIFLESIVEGKCKNNAPNVRRMISILFSRQFEYKENINPIQFMFMDYSEIEKKKMKKDCELYYDNF